MFGKEILQEALGTIENIARVWLEGNKQHAKKIFGEARDEFGMDESFIEFLRPAFQFLYHVYFRVETTGTRNIPAHGPLMFVVNHSGGLPYDGAMIHLALYNESKIKKMARFLVEDFVFDLPLLSGFIQKVGGVRACHENATKLLKKKEVIVVFPEGIKGVGKTYDERYQLRQFGHGGFIKLAIRTKVPIIPVAVTGAEEIHPIVWKSRELAKPFGLPFIPFTPTFPWLGPLGLVPLPSKWKIQFGKVIRFDKYKPSDAENEKLVNKEAEKIRAIVQKMLNKELKKRKSIWI